MPRIVVAARRRRSEAALPVCGSPASILGLSGGLFSLPTRPDHRPVPLCGANLALENRD